MRPWITKTVTELSGVEDDIVIEYTMELLEDPEKPVRSGASSFFSSSSFFFLVVVADQFVTFPFVSFAFGCSSYPIRKRCKSPSSGFWVRT